MVRLGGKLARGHGDKGEMRMRGLVDQRLGGSERLISWPVDKLTSGQGRRRRGGEINSGNNFQVSGLGSREPGSGVQVREQVRNLNFARTRTCT